MVMAMVNLFTIDMLIVKRQRSNVKISRLIFHVSQLFTVQILTQYYSPLPIHDAAFMANVKLIQPLLLYSYQIKVKNQQGIARDNNNGIPLVIGAGYILVAVPKAGRYE